MAARLKSDRRLRVWLHLLGLTWRTDFGASQLFCYVGCFLLPSASTYLILLRHPTKIQNLSQFSGTAEMFFMSAISAACLAENLSGRAAMAGVLLEIKKSESRFVGGIEYDFSGMTWRAVVALAAMGLSSAAVYSVKSPVEFILHLAVYLYPPVLVLVNILKFSTLVALMRRHLEVLGRQIGPFRVEEVLGRVATLNRSWALLCRAFSVRALVVLALVWVLCVQSASNAIRHLLDHGGHVDSLILEPFCWVLVGAVFLFDIVAPSWSIYTEGNKINLRIYKSILVDRSRTLVSNASIRVMEKIILHLKASRFFCLCPFGICIDNTLAFSIAASTMTYIIIFIGYREE